VNQASQQTDGQPDDYQAHNVHDLRIPRQTCAKTGKRTQGVKSARRQTTVRLSAEPSPGGTTGSRGACRVR
jgi:hypothetical protein